jgi:D-glycerate 3-kinase
MQRVVALNHFYHSLVTWLKERVDSTAHFKKPLIIGINGPQGSGKTTLTRSLVAHSTQFGFVSAALSIDDFYLTRRDQVKLSSRYQTNSLLQQRGYPGTHDIELGGRILGLLKEIRQHKSVRVPVYDKSLHLGQGDRLPESEWNELRAPLDLVFLEGWMLGFPAASESLLPNDEFRQINQFLKEYEIWNRFLDGFIQLIPEEISFVSEWRIEAEEKMKANGKTGMSRQEIEAYIHKFLPAYELYLPLLAECPPVRENFIRFTLTKERKPRNESNSSDGEVP